MRTLSIPVPHDPTRIIDFRLGLEAKTGHITLQPIAGKVADEAPGDGTLRRAIAAYYNGSRVTVATDGTILVSSSSEPETVHTVAYIAGQNLWTCTCVNHRKRMEYIVANGHDLEVLRVQPCPHVALYLLHDHLDFVDLVARLNAALDDVPALVTDGVR